MKHAPLKKLALDLYDYLEATALQHAKSVQETAQEASAELKKSLDKQRKQWLRDSGQWDCLLAQSETAAELFCGCFWYQGEILCKGYPRNDKLVQYRNEQSEELPAGLQVMQEVRTDDFVPSR